METLQKNSLKAIDHRHWRELRYKPCSSTSPFVSETRDKVIWVSDAAVAERKRDRDGAGFGGAVGAVGAVRRAAGLRFWGAGGLAGKPSAQALSGLEEAAVAGPTVGHAEEVGPGLSRQKWKLRSTRMKSCCVLNSMN
uniref:Uncharacterized protein n=1 Tax=Sphaerodactylus townsendi TaxID=933632 RepID=A0ACB8GB36_9SAUR